MVLWMDQGMDDVSELSHEGLSKPSRSLACMIHKRYSTLTTGETGVHFCHHVGDKNASASGQADGPYERTNVTTHTSCPLPFPTSIMANPNMKVGFAHCALIRC